MKKTILWVGDAACDSGFAKCTHNTLPGFIPDWNVCVLGMNYRGDPHKFPYPIFPAYVPGSDAFGIGRLRELVLKTRPSVIVFQNDPWNIPRYLEEFKDIPAAVKPVLIGAIAVDGLNCRGWALNDLDHVIFWTKFAEDEARKGGYTGTSTIIPLGVDVNLYKPGDQLEARKRLELPDAIMDGFIVLNVNRNQPRKRLDLTMEYFADFYHNHCPKNDAYLYMHVCPTGDVGWDINQLTKYYGLTKHVILAQPSVFAGSTEAEMVETYQACDLGISTTLGEGWGLTTMEGMACGLPQVVPDWSALGEWAADAAYLVPCSATSATPNKVNVIGGVPDKKFMVDTIAALYRSQLSRKRAGALGVRLANEPKYRWENIATKFAQDVEQVFQRVKGHA